MRKLLLTTVSFVGIATVPGIAADLKSPAFKVPPPVWTWTGVYIGGHVGVGRHDARWDDFDTGRENDPPGAGTAGGCFQASQNDGCSSYLSNKTVWLGGGQVGYNWQIGSLVTGVEIDASWLGNEIRTDWTPTRDNPNITSSHKIDWLMTFRGRAGLAVDRTLVYFTGGVALAKVKNSADASIANCAGPACDPEEIRSLSHSETRVGWTVGGGVEYMVTQNWTFKAEGLYVDLGSSDRIKGVNNEDPNNGPPAHYSGRFTNQLVLGRVGLNYKW